MAKGWAVAAGVGLVLASGAHAGHHTGGGIVPAVTTAAHSASAAAAAIHFAEAQLGKPYLWGGTGPAAFDCSGLVQQAWAAAGVHIDRISQDQWASLPHVSSPQPGDLVFAPGADGTWASPGHVGLFIGGGVVIQAYDTGTYIKRSTLAQFAAGAGGIVGYADPAAG